MTGRRQHTEIPTMINAALIVFWVHGLAERKADQNSHSKQRTERFSRSAFGYSTKNHLNDWTKKIAWSLLVTRYTGSYSYQKIPGLSQKPFGLILQTQQTPPMK